jgi:integrase
MIVEVEMSSRAFRLRIAALLHVSKLTGNLKSRCIFGVSMLRNVTLLRTQKDGKATWRLLGTNGLPLESFSAFADSLIRRHPLNTRKAYCRHLADFFDYLFEAEMAVKASNGGEPVTRIGLAEIVDGYYEYLVYGGDSGKSIARLVDKSRPSPRYTPQTSALMHAPLRKFLSLSEHLRQELEGRFRFPNKEFIDPQPLLPSMHSNMPITPHQRHAMAASSMIAGVIAGGPKLLKNTFLHTVTPQVAYEVNKAFPFDRIASFIEHQKTFRDKAIYAFLAASGCRMHECLQLLLDDIDVDAGLVYLRDPSVRANHQSYLKLQPLERDKLAWKGRTTESTMLIEPFSTIFFENLERYMAKEYIPHGLHRFMFQYLKKGQEGRPYFLSASSTRQQNFKTAVAAAGIQDCIQGPHSLRHAYGTYLLNYFPRSNGHFGLPIAFVQQLMGHSSIKSTLKYARYDTDLIKLELNHANAMIFRGGTQKSIVEMKIEALNAQLNKLQNELIGRTND